MLIKRYISCIEIVLKSRQSIERGLDHLPLVFFRNPPSMMTLMSAVLVL